MLTTVYFLLVCANVIQCTRGNFTVEEHSTFHFSKKQHTYHSCGLVLHTIWLMNTSWSQWCSIWAFLKNYPAHESPKMTIIQHYMNLNMLYSITLVCQWGDVIWAYGYITCILKLDEQTDFCGQEQSLFLVQIMNQDYWMNKMYELFNDNQWIL